MDVNVRELRCFATAAETGSFTDAAAELHISQAAVSRTIASLEREVGEQLLRRMPRGCELTGFGVQMLPHAQRVLAEAARLAAFLASHRDVLRLGYAWAALGRNTAKLQRDWVEVDHGVELELVRHNSPTAGLAEGHSDVGIIRRPLDDARIDSLVVGLERRVVAFASDDPQWARRRQLSMAEIASRTVIVDPRAGTTNSELWGESERPTRILQSGDVDSWLDAIAAGRGVGTTAEATAHHHLRPGVTYRPIKDGPRIPVRLAWWRDAPPKGLSELVDAVTALYALP